jgi:hypothetical protein
MLKKGVADLVTAVKPAGRGPLAGRTIPLTSLAPVMSIL